MEIARHTSHDGKYDPSTLNTGWAEQPVLASTKRLAIKVIHKRRIFGERSNDW
jgi:hypothetical protein